MLIQERILQDKAMLQDSSQTSLDPKPIPTLSLGGRVGAGGSPTPRPPRLCRTSGKGGCLHRLKQSYKYRGGCGRTSPAPLLPGPPRFPLDPPASGIIPPISAAEPAEPAPAPAGAHTSRTEPYLGAVCRTRLFYSSLHNPLRLNPVFNAACKGALSGCAA